MAKRSSGRRNDKQDLEVAGKGDKTTTVRLVCIVGADRYIVDGAVTGNHYEFIGNHALDIDYEDAEVLLSKRRGGCCGNVPSPLFVKV